MTLSVCLCRWGGGVGGGDVPERRGKSRLCCCAGTASLCSQRHWKCFLLLFCFPVILAGLNQDPLILRICGRLFEDKKMSGGNSNDQKVKKKKRSRVIFFPWRSLSVFGEHILVSYTQGIGILKAKYCLLSHVNYIAQQCSSVSRVLL